MTETTTEQRTVSITIPMSPPPELSPNARRRGNVWAQREATATLREMAKYAACLLYVDLDPRWGIYGLPVTIHEHIIWPKSKGVLPDPDALPTYCKAAVDGIVDAGIIRGDSAKHVQSVSASQEKGTDASGSIVITLTEVQPQ